jgi:MFS family permease
VGTSPSVPQPLGRQHLVRQHFGRRASTEGDRSATARRYGVGFWLIAGSLLVAMAFSTVPTPLYPLYARHDHFAALMVTVVFAMYGVGVIASLLLVGHVSDWLGRRPVLFAATAVNLVAAVLFVVSPRLPVLLVGRLFNGISIGLMTATATAHMHELHFRHRPAASPARFEVVSTATNIGGLGVGSLASGFLAQYLTQPLRVPYLIFAVLLLLSLVAIGLAPETVPRRVERPAWRPQRLRIQGDPAVYVIAAGSAFCSLAVFGLFASLAPGFVGGTLHNTSLVLAGATVFLVFGAAAASQIGTEPIHPAPRAAAGIAATTLGLAFAAASIQTVNLALFLAGATIAGAGGGVLFKSAISSVASMAAPATRGEALAGVFTIAYLGLTVPVVGMGVALDYAVTTTAIDGYAGLVITLLAATTVLMIVTRRVKPARTGPGRTG